MIQLLRETTIGLSWATHVPLKPDAELGLMIGKKLQQLLQVPSKLQAVPASKHWPCVPHAVKNLVHHHVAGL